MYSIYFVIAFSEIAQSVVRTSVAVNPGRFVIRNTGSEDPAVPADKSGLCEESSFGSSPSLETRERANRNAGCETAGVVELSFLWIGHRRSIGGSGVRRGEVDGEPSTLLNISEQQSAGGGGKHATAGRFASGSRKNAKFSRESGGESVWRIFCYRNMVSVGEVGS